VDFAPRRVPDCTKSFASMCSHPVHGRSDALRSVALNLLDEHLDHCVSRAVANSVKEAEVKLAEAATAIARLVRL
jgi:hypothetical protein